MAEKKPNNGNIERSLQELFVEDPERADAVVFDRRTDKSRRGFLKGAGLASMAALLGAAIPFWRNFPAGLIPAALADGIDDLVIDGKDGLRVLSDRPLNAETPAHLLDDDVTPVARHFIRNNGTPRTNTDPKQWTLTVDGQVERMLTIGIADLRRDFETVSLRLQLECGGNGRAAFNPPARGNQWTTGAIGNAEWTGVRFRDVLRAAGVKDTAIYTGHYGADSHLSGQSDKLPISRGVPIAKALEPHTLIAFEMNGEPIHPMNGAPLRIVAAGWPGSCSQKWLTRIHVRDVVHDGPKMTGTSYRVPAYPVEPGQKVPKEDFRIIETMPVKSLITYPRSGVEISGPQPSVEVRGHAWAGEVGVRHVDLSMDFGATWIEAKLSPPPNKYSWQRFRAQLSFPVDGYYEIWARATDDNAVTQPFAINWNPKGYLNNSLHRIAIRVVS